MVRRTKSRYHTYLYLSPLKVAVFAGIAFGVHGVPVAQYFTMFTQAWNPHNIFVKRVKYLLNATKRKCLFSVRKKSDEIDFEGYSRMCLGTFVTTYVCVSRKDSSTKKLFNKSARKQKQVPLKT